MSISSQKRLADKLGELAIENMTFKSVVGIAQRLNPMIRGWINYSGKFRVYKLSKVFDYCQHVLYAGYTNGINAIVQV